jgi:hypothetical protein
MSEQYHCARRRLLKALAGTGAVAATGAVTSHWSRPLVESVLLPAHAATSVNGTFATTSALTLNITANDVLDFFVPKAYADVTTACLDLCSTVENGVANCKAIVDVAGLKYYFEGSGIVVGGGTVSLTNVHNCGSVTATISINSVGTTADGTFTFTYLSGSFAISPGTCSLVDPGTCPT